MMDSNKVNGVNADGTDETKVAAETAGMDTNSKTVGTDMTVSNGVSNGRESGTASWPKGCVWPEPTTDSSYWEAEDVERLSPSEMDDWLNGLVEVKEYFDDLVSSGRLNEDYSLNPYFTPDYDVDDADSDDDTADNDDSFTPEKGEEYWEGTGAEARFNLDSWASDV